MLIHSLFSPDFYIFSHDRKPGRLLFWKYVKTMPSTLNRNILSSVCTY